MNCVVDTNVVISELLWHGPPNQLLKWSRNGIIRIFACEEIIAELKRVLNYNRFGKRLPTIGTTSDEIFAYVINIAVLTTSPQRIQKIIVEDPFDNLFLALASENRSHLIIFGDSHLLDLQEYNHIQIITPAKACKVIEIEKGFNPNRA